MSVERCTTLRDTLEAIRRAKIDEEGGATIFSLFIFVVMLLLAGMAVDLMRFETQRTALQNTIDSAVLAAANLEQKTDAETLVKDFFIKSGYDIKGIKVKETQERLGQDADGTGGTLVGRTVEAELDLEVDTLFMGLIGIDLLSGLSAGRAEESVEGVEISLVLDISGSMKGKKLGDLKTAAKNFLGIVMNAEQNPSDIAKTSVSVIPYNANVVVPDALLDRLNTQGIVEVTPTTENYADPFEIPGALVNYEREAANSSCVQFTDDQMVTTDLLKDYAELRAISPTTELARLGYFDEGDKSAGGGDAYNRPADAGNRFCDPTRNAIVVHETRKSVLEEAIDDLSAGGWTSIDNGMKWGVALLDPALRPVINDMVDAELLQEDVRNRPDNYDGTSTMKVIVVMTDGDHTIQRDLRPPFLNGPSPVWFSPETAGFAFETPVSATVANYWNGFYVRLDETGDGYWYQGQLPDDANDGAYYAKDELPADAYQLTYAELYDRLSEDAVADLFLDQAGNDDDRLDDLRTAHLQAVYEPNSYGELDRRLTGDPYGPNHGICDAATFNNDIIVFTIAFEAPEGGQTQMSECATAGGYYFDAKDGVELDEAFRAIAGQITTLRLTQ